MHSPRRWSTSSTTVSYSAIYLHVQGALMNTKKDCLVGFGILPTDVYFQYTTVSQVIFGALSAHIYIRQAGWCGHLCSRVLHVVHALSSTMDHHSTRTSGDTSSSFMTKGTTIFKLASADNQLPNSSSVTVFGTSPRFLTELQLRGIKPRMVRL
jgi:acetoacetyl-CoA synthetase